MDVSAEALSELKLVRPSASPLLPARPRRAREPNQTRRSVGPVRGRRFAASPRVSSPLPLRVRSDRLLPVPPIPSGAHVVPRSQGRAREAQGAAPRARLRGCAAARRRGGGGRARVCANAGGRADDRARVRVPGVPRPGVLQARVRRRVRRRRARVAAGQGSAGAGHGRGAATGRSDAAAGGGVGRGRERGSRKPSAPRRNLRLRLRLTAIKRPSPEISSSPTTRTARTSRRTSTSTTPTPGRRPEARERNRLSRRRPHGTECAGEISRRRRVGARAGGTRALYHIDMYHIDSVSFFF